MIPKLLLNKINAARACLQLGIGLTRTDQNQTRNIVGLLAGDGRLGIPKSVVE